MPHSTQNYSVQFIYTKNSVHFLHAGTGNYRKVTNSHSQFVKDEYEDLRPDINVWFTGTLSLVFMMLYFPQYNHFILLIALSHTNVILANGVTEVKGQTAKVLNRNVLVFC